jgi:pyruvate/2-oxoglutarate/acetoin dehydrogenase E1 component
MRELGFIEALAEALDEILTEDPNLALIGGNFGSLTPHQERVNSVLQKHPGRVSWPSISELGYGGLAIGAAMTGLRTIVDFTSASFAYEAIPQIVNEAAICYSNSAGQVKVPVVFHMLYGLHGGAAAQHSGGPQAWMWNTPGLEVVMPGTPADAKGLLRWAALRSANPTVFLSHRQLFDTRGPVPEGTLDLPFGQATVERAGGDVTVVALGIQVPRALNAADILAAEGIQAEIVNPRTLAPLDTDTILNSVRKTGRVVITEESFDPCGVAAGLAAIIADEGYDSLMAPIKRVSIPPVPIPSAKSLEDTLVPTPERIAQVARKLTRN